MDDGSIHAWSMREREQRFRKKQGDDQRGSEKKKDNMDDRIVLVPSSGLESTLQLLQLWINPYAVPAATAPDPDSTSRYSCMRKGKAAAWAHGGAIIRHATMVVQQPEVNGMVSHT
uniref:Uncharacterized protein n=1 Tax=Oryza sativa subsp. japonica TaxID=39947 RepID=Q6ZI37_ORYSJ|nr:hypothetical protein [Oryza sativa Japonica Group]